MISSFDVYGKVFGKESHTTSAASLRSILPLPCIMQVLDALLANHFQHQVDSLLPVIPECFIGARPKTQCLDIAHGIQSVIEKGLDSHGQAAVAQCDSSASPAA